MLRQGTKILILIAYLTSTLTASGVAIGNFLDQGQYLEITGQTDPIPSDSTIYSESVANGLPGSIPMPGPCEIENGSDEDDFDDEPPLAFVRSTFELQEIIIPTGFDYSAGPSLTAEEGCSLYILNQVFRI